MSNISKTLNSKIYRVMLPVKWATLKPVNVKPANVKPANKTFGSPGTTSGVWTSELFSELVSSSLIRQSVSFVVSCILDLYVDPSHVV